MPPGAPAPPANGGPRPELRDGGGILTLRIFACTKPVIAAINGHAVGVGATMTLPMDVRFAADTAKFGFVFGARGIVPEACSSWFLPRLVGISQAAEWVYTSRVFPASEALAAGLVKSLHPADEVVGARAGAGIRDRPQLGARLRRPQPHDAVADAGRRRPDGGPQDRQPRHQLHRPAARPREGISAFFEKRPARWTIRVSEDLPPFVPWWDPRPFS